MVPHSYLHAYAGTLACLLLHTHTSHASISIRNKTRSPTQSLFLNRLKTVDQYFYGANNSIQHAGVQYILDTVVAQCMMNPDRKFTYVEMAFFQRWWNEQTPHMRDIVKGLVASQQLQFINGGWSMHDEVSAPPTRPWP